ncbi:MAG TPA: OmpA family protein [Terriglobales bacterium]|nr:OmpA family protein [Terriglobales bacterium]
MKHTLQISFILICLLFASTGMFAQEGPTGSSPNVAYWVDYWSRPPVNLFGPDQEAFNTNLQPLLFPWNDHDEPSNPSVLDSDAEWLKAHPDVRFYIDGYASSRGDLFYNLLLSQRRADWVKQTLLSRGVAKSQILVAAGWGQSYPVCPELNDECWSKNRLVRFVYAPPQAATLGK